MFRSLPPVTKYLIIVNTVVLLIDYVCQAHHIYLTGLFGMFNIGNPSMHFWQPLTYMFMHDGFWHLFCNMFAVFMFAPVLENRWGSKRFLLYYLVCGIGAGLVQQLVWFLTGTTGVTVGASGAVFGILFAFGWLFPEVEMFLLFIPIPIRARVFVALYALFELWQGVAPTAGDNVAHFAHLGGMVFGWLLILYWNKRGYSGVQKGEFNSRLGYKIKQWWKDLSDKMHSKRKESRGSYSDYHYQDPVDNNPSADDNDNDEEINRILDKIKLQGYSSLTDEEKAKLFKKGGK